MSIKKLDKQAFKHFVNELIATDQTVVAPTAKADKFAFAPITSADDMRLDYDVTLLPPKKYLLPQVETLMTYQVGGEYSSEISQEKTVLLGVHPYDMVAINQMDEIFSQDESDIHYITRRENTTIIACDVVTPSKDVFASTMATATVKKGYDILITDIDDAWVVEIATPKGTALLANVTAEDASDDDLAKRQAIWDKNNAGLNKHELKCAPADLPAILDKAYDHPVWEEKAKTCYSCGSCTLTCPTCYCFDVQDDVEWDLASGKRTRAWDGCLLEQFANVAGDHNFRKAREDRFRHRIYRKGKYVPAKIDGQIACVGCGRCIGACIPDIANPVAVYNRILEDITPELAHH